jgi:hypothetical protein
MALSRTQHGPYVHNTAGFVAQGTGPYTTSAFSTTSGSLLVAIVIAGTDNPSTGEPSYVLTGGSLTWTKRTSAVGEYSGDGMLVQIWTAPVTTGASITLTSTHTGINSYNMGIYPFTYTGQHATPTGGFAAATSTTTTTALTLSATPASDSEILAAMVVAANDGDAAGATIAPADSFVELAEYTTTDSFYKRQIQTRTGSTSTAVSWTTTTDAGGGYERRIFAALEIKAAAGGVVGRNFGFIIG